MSRSDSSYIASAGLPASSKGLELSRINAYGLSVYKTGRLVPGDDGQLVAQEIAFFDGGKVTPSPQRPQPAFATIYFIGPDDGPIKIGWASNIVTRVRDLRLANAFPLRIWASVGGPPSLEREYHKRFAAHRLHGEWFERHPDILAEIERLNG